MPASNGFRIIRSARRKRVAFRAGADGTLEVLAPPGVPESFLRQLVERESAAVAKIRAAYCRRQQPELSEGAEFHLLGRNYPLHLTGRLRLFDRAFMIPNGSEAEKRTALISLYKELAGIIMARKVAHFAPLCRVEPGKLNINSAATRWGSCSSKKTVSFSWKLIQCPEEAVDYVTVHELCHLKEMNHSPRFWAEVAAIMPDYALRRAKLNAFARTLPCW